MVHPLRKLRPHRLANHHHSSRDRHPHQQLAIQDLQVGPHELDRSVVRLGSEDRVNQLDSITALLARR